MCSATDSNYLRHYPLGLSTQCGEVFCSQSFEDFVINCTRCSKQFNLLCCSLFITHVKECTPELGNHHIGKEEEPILLNDAVNENNIATSETNLCLLMIPKVENVEAQNTSVEEVMLEDVKNEYDDQYEDDIPIADLTRRKKIEAIIDEYKKHPALWDASLNESTSSESAKKYDYEQIREAVNSKLKTNFNDKELRMQILKLRLTYKQVLESKEQIEKGITDGSALLDDLWYFDKISFIGAKSSDIEVEAVPNDDSDQDGFFKASDSHEEEQQPIIFVDNGRPDNINVDFNKEEEEANPNRKKLNNREHVFQIIELYKAEPLLWDPSHHHYTTQNKRRKAISKIISTLSAEHNCQITAEEFRYQINFLSNAYIQAVKQEAAAKGDMRLVIRPYYFDRMSFLEPFVDSKTSSKPKALIENLTFLTENKPLMIEFIKLYEEQSCLWNPKHEDRHNQLAMTEAYDRIVNMFRQNDVFVTKTEVISAIKFLHNTEIYSRKKLEFNDPSKSSESPVWFYEHLQFLAKVPRKKDIHCTHCDQYFRKVADYKKHRIEIVGDYPYKCSICNAGFMVRSKYITHKITHNEQLTCEECGFKTLDKCNFGVHMRRHKGIKPYKCEQCDTAYVTSTELHGHLRTHASVERFPCDICEKSFALKSSLNRHMLGHGTPNFKCNVCLKDFYTRGYLRIHMVSHLSERKHACEVCRAAFKSKNHLFRHRRRHTAQIKEN